jgi:hypothetical protein
MKTQGHDDRKTRKAQRHSEEDYSCGPKSESGAYGRLGCCVASVVGRRTIGSSSWGAPDGESGELERDLQS